MMIFRETFWNTAYWEEKGFEYWLDYLFVESVQWQILIPAILLGICFALVVYKLIKITRMQNDS